MYKLFKVVEALFQKKTSAEYGEALIKRREEKLLRNKGYSRNEAKRIIAAKYQ